MAEPGDPSDDLGFAERLPLDGVCVEFSREWRNKRPPAIETYLQRIDDPRLRAALLERLLPLDIEHRRGRGENPEAGQYIARFPAHEGLILKLIHPQLLNGRYEVLKLLGTGGMGCVFLARDTKLENKRVAIKSILDRLARNSNAIERFADEVKILAQIHQHFVVKILDRFHEAGSAYLVMEHLDGGSLADYLKQPARAEPQRHEQLGRELAEAVAAVHRAGFVHRDLKPGNFLLSLDWHIKLADFGLAARVPSSDSNASTAQTAPGSRVGTTGYMSPEQVRGERVGKASDVFALGIVLFLLLTGAHPFKRANETATDKAIENEEPGDSESRARLKQNPLGEVVLRLLEKLPERRPADGGAVLDEINRALLPPKPSPPKSRLAMLSAVVVTCAIAFGLGALGRKSDALALAHLRPLVTEGSNEADGRLSPDGRWLSFLSDRSGTMRLYIRELERAAPKPLGPTEGRVLGHAWSPDGRQVACLVEESGASFVDLYPAPIGGSRLLRLEVRRSLQDVVGWAGSGLYLGSTSKLWRLNLATGDLGKLALAPEGCSQRDFDLDPLGEQVVFVADCQGQSDIWSMPLRDAAVPHRLTTDVDLEFAPRWLDSSTVVYLAGSPAELSLWRVASTGGAPSRVHLTTSPYSLGRAAQQERLVAEIERESLDLWRQQGSARAVRLTDNSRLDFWPNRAGSSIVFQRFRSEAGADDAIHSCEILHAQLTDRGLVGETLVADAGGLAVLSDDGEWVAYVGANEQLWAFHVATGRRLSVAERVPLASFRPYPLEPNGPRHVFLPTSHVLVYVTRVDPGMQLQRRDLGAPDGPESSPLAGTLGSFRTPWPSPDGSRIAVAEVLAGRDTGAGEVAIRLVANGAVTTPFELTTEDCSRLSLCGWRDADHLVVLQAGPEEDDGTQPIRIIEVSTSGDRRDVAGVRGFLQTARLGGHGDTIYVTVAESGIHDIAAVSLVDGERRLVTHNDLPGVSFCGMAPEGDDLVFSEHVRNIDLALLSLGQ